MILLLVLGKIKEKFLQFKYKGILFSIYKIELTSLKSLNTSEKNIIL